MADEIKSSAGGEQAKFNPALAFVQALSKLIDASDFFFIQKDYENCNLILKRIFMRAEHRLSDEEIKSLDKKFEEIHSLINKHDDLKYMTGQERYSLRTSLENINRDILRLLHKYGLLVPNQKDINKSIIDL